jgi:DNA-binding transcriptional regulator WhiA
MFNELFKNLPEQTTSDGEYYVDFVSGTVDGDGSPESPFADFIYLPRTINHNIDLCIIATVFGTTGLDLYGNGKIVLYIKDQNDLDVTCNSIIKDCFCELSIDDLEIIAIDENTPARLNITNCRNINVKNLTADTVSAVTTLTITNSKVNMYDCSLEGSTICALRIINSEVSIEACTFASTGGTDIILEDASVLYVVGTDNTYTTYSVTGGSKIITVDSMTEVAP